MSATGLAPRHDTTATTVSSRPVTLAPAVRPDSAAAAVASAQGRLATTLALIAGYIDAYVFLNYQSYASFMSGNTTQTGLRLGQWQLAQAGRNLLPIPAFFFGIFLGTLLIASSRPKPLRRLFAAVAGLLVVGLVAGYVGVSHGWPVIIVLSLAMGLMNTTVTRVGEQPVSLGYVTGVLNNLAQHLALAAKGAPVPLAQGPWDTHGRRARLLAILWLSFLFGALLASAATVYFAAWTLLPPLVILLLLAAFHE